MLRITTDESPQVFTLRLEGRVEGPWVAVLAECWSKAVPRFGGRWVCVDLNGVTFIDAQGKARLAEMYAQGVELLAEDLETRAIVAEIRANRIGGADDGDGEASPMNRPKPMADIGEQLTDLQRLQAELHEVNEELARSAGPLDRVSELNEEQRRAVAAQLRAGLACWESVTQRIAQVLGLDGANGNSAETHEGGSR